MSRLDFTFYAKDAVTVAENLLGKILIRRWEDGSFSRYIITETEAYFGEEDKACHASKGRTPRTEIMYASGGHVYVYFIYGMYWMLNVVTGPENHPEAVLIRGLNDIIGSGKVGRELKLDRSFYGENLITSQRIWIENTNEKIVFKSAPRIGINYAGEEWINKPWRFILEREKNPPSLK
ncbi:MAG TPA: DNA-3-methyladenine glycosylase [Paludibacteraceae bacterium]|nr:DNA-3-methyladenine glycosylase [Paludibacteraceae bacterium]HOL00144.1 DNA-3-methyladenine glycosylase [Paludibacteraceae bacterium]HPO67035.1 DNA-3-methyladenine glycosylase [Paludibacteraceae bacterium]